MSKDACNADNVMAKLVAHLEAGGIDTDISYVSKLPETAQLVYHDGANRAGAEELKAIPDDIADQVMKTITEDVPHENAFARTINDQRNPSGMLGESRVKPMIDFMREHVNKYGNDPAKGKKAYYGEIQKVLKGIKEDGLNKHQKAYLEQYKNFYKAGGELYAKHDGKTGIVELLSTYGSNVVKSSPTVLIGNVLEGIIKVPSLYPTTAMPGFARALEKGLWTKLPKLKQVGAYGDEEAKGLLQKWQGLMGITDVPLKNIAYFAGLEKGGEAEALRAIQRIAYMPRLGDSPRQFWKKGNNLEVRFLNYGVNSLKMYGSLWGNALNPAKGETTRAAALGSLGLYHGIALGLGAAGGAIEGKDPLLAGVSGAIPEPAKIFVKAFSPEAAQALQDNETGIGQLSQINAIRTVGPLFSSAQRNTDTMMRNTNKAIDYMHNGEIGLATINLAEAALRGLQFTKTAFFSDAQVTKLVSLMRKDAEGTADKPLNEELIDYFFPFLHARD